MLRRLARISLAFTLSNVGGLALSFGQTLLIARLMGQAGLGQWAFSTTWATLLTWLAEFGLNTWLTRAIARAPHAATQALVDSLVIKGILILLSGLGVWLAAPWLAPAPPLISATRWAVWLAVWGLGYGSFSALLRAVHWGWQSAVLNIGWLLAQLAGTAWVLAGRGDVVALMQVAVGAQALQLLVVGVWWWVALRPQGGGWQWQAAALPPIARAAWPFMLAAILNIIQLRLPILLLTYIHGEAELGLFSAAWRFGELPKLALGGLFAAAFPAFVASHGAQHQRLFRWFYWGTLAFALSAALALGLSAPWLLALTYGPAFLPAQAALQLLGLGTLPVLISYGLSLYLYAIGAEHHVLRWEALSTALQALLSLALVFPFGASGLALAWGLSRLPLWWGFGRIAGAQTAPITDRD